MASHVWCLSRIVADHRPAVFANSFAFVSFSPLSFLEMVQLKCCHTSALKVDGTSAKQPCGMVVDFITGSRWHHDLFFIAILQNLIRYIPNENQALHVLLLDIHFPFP